MLGRAVEAVIGALERERVGPPLVLAGQPQREPDQEGRVGQHVGDGRAGGQGAHLDPQVSPGRGIVDGPVPAPDRALVQPELVQDRSAGISAAGWRVADEGQQRLVPPDALGEQLERAAAQPARAERRARWAAPQAAAVAVLDRLLEQRDPGLLPEPAAEEGRRVAGRGQGRGGGQLGRVVDPGEVRRGDPQVQLERGVRPLEHDVFGGQLQRFFAGDPDEERAPVQPPQAAVQCPVAGRVGHHAQVNVGQAEGRQDADQRDPAVVCPGRGVGPGQELAELAGQRGERVSGQRHRRGVQLQVVPVELERDPGVGGQGADGLVPRQRPGRVVDQAHFELGADRHRAGAEAGPGEQPPQVGQALLEPFPEPGVVALAELLPGDLGSHRSTPP